jgi:hypothetical protein
MQQLDSNVSSIPANSDLDGKTRPLERKQSRNYSAKPVDYQSDEADISSAESDYSTGSRGHLEFAENNSYDLPPLKFSELGYEGLHVGTSPYL